MTIAGKTFTVTQTGSGGGSSPSPDIKVNGLDGPITLGTADTLSVEVSLDPGSSSGVDADWWLAAETPFGWQSFSSATGWSLAGASMTDIVVWQQLALFNLSAFEVLNASLPVGTYTYYFMIDMNMNGLLDLGEAFFDTVVINIEP